MSELTSNLISTLSALLTCYRRIETALQRYKARRNFDAERREAFDKYLALGGIDVSPKMFGGVDAQDMKEMEADEIRTARATTTIGTDKTNLDGPDAKYVVDFEAIAKGFLYVHSSLVLPSHSPQLYSQPTSSSIVPINWDLISHPKVKSFTTLILNFLNYLLHHDVCPEYTDSIQAARAICKTAERELWLASQAARWLPGDFNKACSTLFGGSYAKTFIGEGTTWDASTDVPAGENLYIGMSPNEARNVILFALAGVGTEDIIQPFKRLGKNIKITKSEEMGLEVIAVEPADADTKAFYETSTAVYRPLGKLRVKPWFHPAAPDEDFTDSESEATFHRERQHRLDTEVREFWVEDNVLEWCFVGMKFEATVRELNFGVSFFDEVQAVMCGFYEFLDAEMMVGWKEHVALVRKGVARDDMVDGEEVEGGEADDSADEEMM